MVMADVSDVVVVGGGIGGASLAFALAGAGVGVTVLEASTEFADRVRGESLQAWGVKEARDLGVAQVLLDAGAHITPVWKQYLEGAGDVGDIPMAMMIPDIPGSLNLRHPDACQALLDAAAAVGATVVRGVRDVVLAVGNSPTVTYATNGQVTELRSTLVVGADGRASTVRKQAGITLDRQEPISYIAGLLVDGLDGVPDDHDVVAGEGDVFFLVFHQGGGRARVYLCTGVSGQHRFSGRTGTEQFLAACNVSCYPWSNQVMAATPAGPCATYAGDDTWTDTPFADGVVLIGDAAGYNDPIIGQGLSLALRDARIARDLILDGARHSAAFAPYGQERATRMERVRFIADVLAVAQAEDADNRSARRAMMADKMATMDPEIFPLMLSAFAGPETIPEEALDPGILERLRSA
jgi:2-polyprenyl-6-methoxyphenol hydroxylase-like FAD-dependent oxidoreductase